MTEQAKDELLKKLEKSERKIERYRNLVRQMGKKYNKKKQELILRIQDRIADLAKANQRLNGEIRERKHAEEINRTLFIISNAVNTTFDLNELYRSIYHALSHIIDVTNFYIALYDKEKKQISFPYFVDETDDDFSAITNFDISNSLTGEVILTKKPVFLKRKELEQRAAKNMLIGPVAQVWMGVPLTVKNEVIGVIAVQNYCDQNKFSEKDVEILHSVSEQVAIAIERKRDADSLRKSEKRYRMLFEQSNDAVIIHCRNRIIDVNPSAEKMLGYKREAMISMPVSHIYPDKKLSDEIIFARSGGTRFETRWAHADGSYIDVEVSSSFVDPAGEIIQDIGRDISERKRMEKEKIKIEAKLNHARNLETISTMAGGIVHDFSNLLAIISGNIYMAESDMKAGSESSKFLNAAKKACDNAAKLTRQLIICSKGMSFEKKPANIKKLLKDIIDDAGLDNGITVNYEISNDLSLVKIDIEQMKYAIGNIIANAAETMKNRGSISLTAENIKIPVHGGKESLILPKGNYVNIIISDEGPGIPEKNLPLIFNPYFSTKEMGSQKGMGLSLAITYSVIEKHGGYIEVFSDLGKGTSFSIYLPAFKNKNFSADKKIFDHKI